MQRKNIPTLLFFILKSQRNILLQDEQIAIIDDQLD